MRNTDVTYRWRKLRLRAFLGSGLLAILCLVIASCASASTKKSEAPINISQIIPLSGAAQETTPYIAASVRMAADWINGTGGIDGHKVQVHVCDEQNNPNQDVVCARKAIAEHSVACVGCYSVYSKIDPVLATAKIPSIGGNTFSQTDATSPISFPLDNGPLITAGAAALAGAKCDGSSAFVAEEIPSIKEVMGLAQASIEAAGGKSGTQVALPGAATDFSAQATQVATGGDKCVVLGIGQPNAEVFIPALWAAGSHQRLVGLGGTSIDSQLVAKFGSRLNGSLIGDAFPPLSSPAWAQYRAAIKKYSSMGAQDWSNIGAEQAWVGMVVLKEALQGDPTATAPQLLARMNKMQHVTTGGLTPTLNFTKPFPVKTLDRIFNPVVVFEQVENGKIVWLDHKFHNLTPVLTGGHFS